MSYTYILQVKELFGRHLTAREISRRLHINITDVEQALEFLAHERVEHAVKYHQVS